MTRVVAICHSLEIETFCSVLHQQEREEKGMSYDEIVAHCCKEIENCDGMLALIRSQEESNGMKVELEHLQTLGKPLFLVIREGLDF
jgi:nucleoside 2-deoxyribosyltransferase